MSNREATYPRFPVFTSDVLGYWGLVQEICDKGILLTGKAEKTTAHASILAILENELAQYQDAFSKGKKRHNTTPETIRKALSLVKKIADIPFGGLFRQSTTKEIKYSLVLASVDLLSKIGLYGDERQNKELLDMLSNLTKKAKFIGVKGSSGYQQMMEQLLKFYDDRHAVKDRRLDSLTLSLVKSTPRKHASQELFAAQMNLLQALLKKCHQNCRNEAFHLATKICASAPSKMAGQQALSNFRRAYFATGKKEIRVIHLGETPSESTTHITPSVAATPASKKPVLVGDEAVSAEVVKKRTSPARVSVLGMLNPAIASFRRLATSLCAKACSVCASLIPENLFSYSALKKTALTATIVLSSMIFVLSPSSTMNSNPTVQNVSQFQTVAAHQPFQSVKQITMGTAAQDTLKTTNIGISAIVIMDTSYSGLPTENLASIPTQKQPVLAAVDKGVSNNSDSATAPAAIDAEIDHPISLASQPFMMDGSDEAIAIKDTLKKMPKWLQNLSISEDANAVVNICNQGAAELLKDSKNYRDRETARIYKKAAALLATYGSSIVDVGNYKVLPAFAEPIHAKMAYMLAWGIGMDKQNIPAALAFAKVAGDAENGLGKRLMELYPSTPPSQTKMAYSHSLYNFGVN